MSKIAFLGDLHAGVRNDNAAVRNAHVSYLRDHFIPYLVENGIKTIIQVGDLFDRRKYTNHLTLQYWRKNFYDKLLALGITVYTIPGNHDLFFKNTLEVNTIELMLGGHYPNINLINNVQDIEVEGTSFLFVPWICAENEKEVMAAIKASRSQFVIGHLELAGFEMQRGQLAEHGMDGKLFENFNTVFTGHYHHKSKIGNVHYLGTPYEITWADYDDRRGFYIFDTVKQEAEFIQNTNYLFHKITYDDVGQDLATYASMDLTGYKDTYVKLIVKNKQNAYLFDIFVERIEKNEVIDLQIIEDKFSLGIDDAEGIVSEAQDTVTILNNYIDQLTINNKDVVKRFFDAIHREALNRE